MSQYTFEQVFALVRLAHKYHIEDVQRQAVYLLREHAFNDNYSIWQENSTKTEWIKDVHCIGVVTLARLVDVPEMLPIALYRCLRLEGAILDGWKRSDGSVEYLSTEDLKRCIKGWGALATDALHWVSFFSDTGPTYRCKDRTTCSNAWRGLTKHVIGEHAEGMARGIGIVEPWDAIVYDALDNCGLCEDCNGVLRGRELVYKENIWRSLPDIFSVQAPAWGRGVVDSPLK